MKAFVVIQVPRGIFIKKTENGQFKPMNIVADEADTYEQAVVLRDKLRSESDLRKSEADDIWHSRWNKAMERGDMGQLNHLSGVK